MNFSELIGQKILIQTAMEELEQQMIGGSAATAELTGVEPGGIWIIHPGLQNGLAECCKIRGAMTERRGITIHVFLPYSSIRFVAAQQLSDPAVLTGSSRDSRRTAMTRR